MPKSAAAAKNKSSDIELTRVYDAPVSMVWDAWTDPAKAAVWWGPRGFTLTTHSKDLRPGGHWKYTMHGPDGTDFPNLATYLEVEKHKKLVYDHGATEDAPPLFRVTVLFSQSKGRTKIEMTMSLPTPEAAEKTRQFIKKAGGDSTWDRFAEYLDKQSTGRESFFINRTFDASVEELFDLWTRPELLSRWLPPTGATMEFIRADVRPGGKSFYSMTPAQGPKMHGSVEYVEISRPDKLVYRQRFVDEREGPARHPMAPTWPDTMLTTVLFASEGPARARVTVIWAPEGATPVEVETFTKARAGMTQGWTGSFDKLESVILERKGA